MASSLRDIKGRITLTKKTSQITNAMHLVSQAKVRQSEKKYKEYQDFLARIAALTKTVLTDPKIADLNHPLLNHNEDIIKTTYLVITSDSGLLGAYNNNIYKELEEQIKTHQSPEEYQVAVIGRKGFAQLSKKHKLVNKEAILIRDDVMFIDIAHISKKIINEYISGKVNKIVIIYNHYINMIKQTTNIKKILPLDEIDATVLTTNYTYEESIEDILQQILPMYLQDLIYGIILDAKTAEHSSRTTAMKNATDNATDIIDKLQILYNRARQEDITNELIDIISGAGAVGG